MKQHHFLDMLFKKNGKGRMRNIRLQPKRILPVWSKGIRNESKRNVVIPCGHCGVSMGVPNGRLAMSATCFNCIERARLVRLQAGLEA